VASDDTKAELEIGNSELEVSSKIEDETGSKVGI